MQHAGREDIGILAPRRLQEGKLFTHEFQGYNLTNPFASMYTGKLAKQTVTGPVEIQGAAFEGPFIRREVVGKIGYPNKDLFIFVMIRTIVSVRYRRDSEFCMFLMR